MRQLEVQIMDQNYVLGCPEGGEPWLLQAVQRVDAAMCKIRDAGKHKARDRIAVLASLNLAFSLVQNETELAAAAAVVSAGTAEIPHDVSARLEQLLRRLDQALAADDHLL